MNKAQLVEALTSRIGDRRTAAAAVDGLVDVIVETVGSGSSVTLTGFGVFEPRRRAARVARNPRTGETVPVPETVVPSFRPGAAFREQIGSSRAAAKGATSAPRRSPRTGDTVSADAVPAQPTRSSRGRAKSATTASKTPAKTAPKTAAKAAPKTAAAKTAPKSAAAKPAAKSATAKPAAKSAAAKPAAKAAPKTSAKGTTSAAKAPAAGKTAASGTAKTTKAPAKRTTRAKA